MDPVRRNLLMGVLAAAAVGCSGAAPSGPVQPATTSPPPGSADGAAPSPTASLAVASRKPACPTAIVGDPDPDKVIVATANIYSAGRAEPRAPGGGGTGNLPPMWPLPAGETRVVTVSDTAGCVTPVIGTFPYNGPAGDLKGPTNINAYQGISGIVHGGNGMFLAGVFLTDAEPQNPAPETLDFTDGEDFEIIEPEVGQVFFVGDGVGKRFIAPSDATRLFLGFADAALYTGDPGWYSNNAGRVQASVTIAVE